MVGEVHQNPVLTEICNKVW